MWNSEISNFRMTHMSSTPKAAERAQVFIGLGHEILERSGGLIDLHELLSNSHSGGE